MGDWKFDVSGMTPAQLRLIVEAVQDRANRLRSQPFGYEVETLRFLNDVVMRLERGLPDHKPFPQGFVL